MGSAIFQQIQKAKTWHIVLFFVLVSLVLSEIIVLGMQLLLFGAVTWDYLLTGVITSLFVSMVVLYFVVGAFGRIREHEERFQGAFDAAAIGMALVGLDGRWLKVNRSLCEIVGYTERELLEKTFQDITHPEDLDADLRHVRSLVAGEIPHYHMEKRYFHKDGSIIWILLSGSLVRTTQGKPLHFVAQIEDITSRKMAGEELRKREEILDMAQRMANLGSWEQDLATGKMRWSDHLYRIAGYMPDEIPPAMENFFNLLHPEDAGAVQQAINRMVRDGTPFDMEFRIIRKDGAERIIHAQTERLVPDTQQKIMYGIAQDITERKELTTAYQNVRKLLLEAQQIAHVGSWEWDAVHDRTFWTDENFRIFGYQPGAVAPSYEMFMACIHPDDRKKVADGLEMCLRDRKGLDREFRIVRKNDGAVRVVHDLGKPSFDASGNLLGIVGTTQDITESKRGEQALRESEARFRSVVDNVGIGVSLISPDMEILTLNKQMRDWFPQIDVSSKPICYMAFNLPPRESICTYCPTCKTLQDGETHESVTETPAGGKTVNYRIVSSPIKDEAGKVIAAIELVEDITRQKMAEEELRQHNIELDRMMEELKKTQSFLVRSEKLASIGTLSAGVAHEILNPLNIISTIVQMMQMEEWPVEAKEKYAEIMTQVRRATKITDNLRMFAHLHKDEVTLVDPQALFDKTATLIEHDLNLDNITIERDFGHGLTRIEADEDKLAQVFLNLLTNARDALKGRKQATITVKTRSLDGGVELTFTDNGCGMPAEIIDRIFDPFFTTKEPGKGTGLGLSLVHAIIERLEGTIKVNSQVDGGTTFTITLPIKGANPKRREKSQEVHA